MGRTLAVIADDLDERARTAFWAYIRNSNTAVDFSPGRCPMRLIQIMELKKRVDSGHFFRDDLEPGGVD